MKTRNKVFNYFCMAFFVIICMLDTSCGSQPAPINLPFTSPPEIQTNFSFPLHGSANKVNLTADIVPVGIVFVNSEEIIDHLGYNSGSKITYEMFMREASKLQAHEVININIDINVNRSVDETKFTYTGTGLAIRYTDAKINMDTNSIDELPDTMNIPDNYRNKIGSGQLISNDSGISFLSDSTRLIVLSVTGTVRRSTGGSTSALVKTNDVFTADAIITINFGSSLVLSDGSRNYTVTGPHNRGKISTLLR